MDTHDLTHAHAPDPSADPGAHPAVGGHGHGAAAGRAGATADLLALGPELTIAFAAATRDSLADAVAAHRAAGAAAALALDLSGVTEMDSAGVQLLLAARLSLSRQGQALHLHAPSRPVADALGTFGLHPWLPTVPPQA